MNPLIEQGIARVKGLSPWHKALGAVLAVLFLVLAVRAADDYRWSDWGFGDAQTMLSLRQWEEGGWSKNYFLFKPQGYAAVVDRFDEPELRHHAHGTCPGSSPRVGPRLLYTHYPAGYLVPYAVLFKLGLDGLFPVRMLSLLFSAGALLLMYLMFSKITSPRVAFVAVLFYAFTPAFLGYADSLANQPVDDLLRFGFMYAVVMAGRAVGPEQRRWTVAAWVLEFLLSLTSFDSVFFIYAWLIGWDLLEKRGFRWRTYLLFSLAPVTAHGLQFLQNVWYLGWTDAVIDIKDAFLLKHGADTGYNVGQGRLGVILASVAMVFQNLMNPGWLLFLLLGLFLLYRRYLGGQGSDLPSAALLAVLFLCGLAFILILPHAARMPYEARQMAPFAGLIVSGFSWSFLDAFRASLHGRREPADSEAPQAAPRSAVAYLVLSAVLLVVFWFSFALQGRGSVYDITRIMPEVRFAETLRTMPTKHEPVFFDIGGFQTFWDPNYVPGYPQILPITEYYTGSRPVLCFNEAEGIAGDLAALVRKGGPRFSPVLIAADPEGIQATIELLRSNGVITGQPPAYRVMERFVVDLTDQVQWGDVP